MKSNLLYPFLILFFLFPFSGCYQSSTLKEYARINDEQLAKLKSHPPYPDKLSSSKRAITPKVEYNEVGQPFVRLDIKSALKIAVANNIDHLNQKDNLVLQKLSLDLVRHNYGTILQPLTGTASYSRTSDPGTGLEFESINTSISQKLPIGGSLAIGVNNSLNQGSSDTNSLSQSATITIPVWQNSGRLYAKEDLVSSERNYIYSNRSFNFNKQAFLISTLQLYLQNITAEKSIKNFKKNLEMSKRSLKQSEALYKLGRGTKADVFAAEFKVTQAENSVNQAKEGLKLSKDSFKIYLGIEIKNDIMFEEYKVEYKPANTQLEEYIQNALTNNPDWKNTQDRFEDQKRQLFLAKKASQNKLDFMASAGSSQASQEAIADVTSNPNTWSVGLNYSINIDRTQQKKDYQTALIAFNQAERNFDRAKDNLITNIKNRYIAVSQADFQVKAQQKLIVEAEKTFKVKKFDYLRGKATNLEVSVAQDQLIAAQNDLENAMASYKIARLNLEYYTGLINIDENGEWLK